MPVPTSAARAEEFNRLLVEQARVTRTMQYGWVPDDEQRAVIDARATRLLELAELLPGAEIEARARDIPFEPGAYVNERIAQWLRANPLSLSQRLLRRHIGKEHLDGGVNVVIGAPGDGGYYYRVMASDLTTVNGQLEVRIPDSVAEHFRKQGERRIQRELADLLALKSHL